MYLLNNKYHSAITHPQVSQIGCGCGFTIAAKADSHSLWTTGLNSFSQLGRQLSSSSGQGIGILNTYIIVNIPTQGFLEILTGAQGEGSL